MNADEIARGLSPFQPENVSIEAGKIMLRRLQGLLAQNENFAFETTLSSRSFVGFIKQARELRYRINLIFYWLDSTELAIDRVNVRVADGGHHIPTNTIIRRYYAGLNNFFLLYKDAVDYWMLIDNSNKVPNLVAQGKIGEQPQVQNQEKWKIINQLLNDTHRN